MVRSRASQPAAALRPSEDGTGTAGGFLEHGHANKSSTQTAGRSLVLLMMCILHMVVYPGTNSWSSYSYRGFIQQQCFLLSGSTLH